MSRSRSRPKTIAPPARRDGESPVDAGRGRPRYLPGLVAGLACASYELYPLQSWGPSLACLAAAAALSVILPIVKRQPLGAVRQVAVVVFCPFLLAGISRCVDFAEIRAHAVPYADAVCGGILRTLGYEATPTGRLLLLKHAEGPVALLLSPEKLPLRACLHLLAAWLLIRIASGLRNGKAVVATGLVVVATLALGKTVLTILVFLEHSNILVSPEGHSAFNLFFHPYANGLLLVVGGIALDVIAGVGLPVESAPRRASGTTWGRAALLGLCAWACGFAAFAVPSGPSGRGRVLVDDRFCGVWEPTARMLDTRWYGDFPTYSFTSLCEWLGHWFAVDVNVSRPYDDRLLRDFDVLVLKTPVMPVPEAEVAAIERFVRRGGGLLLVGDHTNLLGMGTFLNALSVKHGIRFRYDAVSERYGGGFVRYSPPAAGKHPVVSDVRDLEFMTSCSLELSGHAAPIIVASDCRRDPQDYAGSSFFGRTGPHPELEQGATVLAASVDVGRGRIAAFTDSTIWSSFAVYQHDRERLAFNLVSFLNRAASPLERPRPLLAVGLAALTLWLGLRLARSEPADLILMASVLGVWVGAASSDLAHEFLYRRPVPREAVQEVAFLWKGGACAFPPVLGNSGAVPDERCFDTLFVSVARLGLVPYIASTFDRDLLRPSTRAIVVVAPVEAPPPPVLSQIRAFVEDGGHLLLVDDPAQRAPAAAQYLAAFGMTLSYHEHTDANQGRSVIAVVDAMSTYPGEGRHATSTFVRGVGRGTVVYVPECRSFSRAGMGHCFARPWKAAKAAYDQVFDVFTEVMRVAPLERRFYGIL